MQKLLTFTFIATILCATSAFAGGARLNQSGTFTITSTSAKYSPPADFDVYTQQNHQDICQVKDVFNRWTIQTTSPLYNQTNFTMLKTAAKNHTSVKLTGNTCDGDGALIITEIG